MTKLITVELGCGNVNNLNVDVKVDLRPLPHVNYVTDATDLQELPDASVALIKSSAMLEHLNAEQQQRGVIEWKRVLAPYGIIVIQTPDREWIDRAAERGDITREWAETLKRGGHTHEHDVHFALLSDQELRALFERHGFKTLSLRNGDEVAGSLEIMVEKV